DTYITHDLLARLGVEEFIAVGDQDRAVHVARGEMLRSGMRLTEATAALCTKLDVLATVLPMTDSVVTTYVKTRRGEMHFQEYWVKHRGDVAIEGVVRRYRQPPVATDEVIRTIDASDAVVIGPSNPVTSISPILECAGVREALRSKLVIAVSPFIGDAPVSGPAAALMRAFGKEPSSAGTYSLYRDFVDIFIQDIRDPVMIDGALRLDTLMVYRGKSLDLAKNILTLIYGC
nr:YvcK family protein [Methanoculleus sp.]